MDREASTDVGLQGGLDTTELTKLNTVITGRNFKLTILKEEQDS